MIKRILGVFGVSAMGQVINLLVRIVSMPVFLNFWGKDVYGEWLILLAIPTYLTISGTGFSVVAANEMAIRTSKGLQKEALGIFQSVWLFITCLSLLFLLCGVICAFVFPIARWLNIRHILPIQTSLTLVLMAAYTACFLQGELLMGVCRAGKIFARGLFINNLILFAENVGLLLAVVLSSDILVAVSVYLSVRVLGTIFLVLVLKKKVKWLRFGYRNASVQTVRANLLPTLSFIGINISNAFTAQGIITIIGIRLGAVAVVGFSVVRTLVNLIKQVNTLIYYSVWPEFSTALAVENRELAKKLHRYACQFTLLFTLTNVVFLVIFGMAVIKFWTNGKIEFDYAFLVLMLVAMLPNTVYVTSSYVQVSINKLGKIAVLCLLASVTSMSFIYVAAPLMGILSAPVALLLVDSVLLFIVVKDSLQIVGDKASAFIQSLFVFDHIRKLKLRSLFLR